MNALHVFVQLAKWKIAWILRLLGVTRRLARRRARRGDVVVLWLHRIDGSPDARLPMAVPPSVFREMIQELIRRYPVVGFRDAIADPTGSGDSSHDAPRVVITFDDGYRDNAETAWPILRDAGAPGLFCLTSGYVDGRVPLWWELVAENRRPPGSTRYPTNPAGEATYGPAAENEIAGLKTLPDARRRLHIETLSPRPTPEALDWDMARALLAQGAEFAAHSVTHPILTRCEDPELIEELRIGRERLEAELGVEVRTLAYPNGSHDDRVVGAAREAGYTHAFTIEKGYLGPDTDPMRIPRIGVSEPRYSLDGRGFSWTLFEAEILGVFDIVLLRSWRRRRGRG